MSFLTCTLALFSCTSVNMLLSFIYRAVIQVTCFDLDDEAHLMDLQLDILLYNRRELSGQRSCHPAQVFGLNRDSSSPFITMDRFTSL